MSRGTRGPAGRGARHDRLLKDERHDPYRETGKLADPTVCPECSACYREGRWTWRPAPADAATALCPACRRIQDDYPGGYLTLAGAFAKEHEQEILGLLHNVEERQREEHPLQRLMAVDRQEEDWLVTTTDPHLAHAMGTALQRAYEGDLEATWAEGQTLLRARWSR